MEAKPEERILRNALFREQEKEDKPMKAAEERNERWEERQRSAVCHMPRKENFRNEVVVGPVWPRGEAWAKTTEFEALRRADVDSVAPKVELQRAKGHGNFT